MSWTAVGRDRPHPAQLKNNVRPLRTRMSNPDPYLRRTVRLVALLNLAYFGVEFAVARSIGSVSLFADSIDFLEDTAINLLILVALGWSAHRRSLVGMALAGILLVPGLAGGRALRLSLIRVLRARRLCRILRGRVG